MTGWGVKISPQGGGQFEEQGGGREWELSKKARKQCFCAKKIITFCGATRKKIKIS